MRRRVPLNSFRAFEAVARHKSLVRAADELCVTSTAVSHQIRQMEEFLQVRLFDRRSSGLVLTQRGYSCLLKLTDAFDLIDEAVVAATQPQVSRHSLTVGASASVAALWLMPRLQDFMLAESDIDVSVQTFIHRSAIEAEQTDLWIGNWRTNLDRKIELFMEEEIMPACSPQVLQKYGSMGEVLRHAPLIHAERNRTESNPTPDWPLYLAEYGISRSDANIGARFNQFSSALEACRAGYGVILGRSILMGENLADGHLIKLGESYPVRTPYYLISPWRKTSPEIFERFRGWLLAQVTPGSSLRTRTPSSDRTTVTL